MVLNKMKFNFNNSAKNIKTNSSFYYLKIRTQLIIKYNGRKGKLVCKCPKTEKYSIRPVSIS